MTAAAYPKLRELPAALIQGRAADAIGVDPTFPPVTTSTTTAPREFASAGSVLDALRSSGMRVSTPRRVIVEALFAADRPVSAQEIAAGLDGERTRLDLASVYRNLETLESLGIVRHVHAGHGAGRYVLAGRAREYVACERCGAVSEIDSRRLDGPRAEVLRQSGYRVSFAHFPLVGVCPRCADRETGR
jgi:Fur family ferric uptake transcriptional regulator